MPKSSKKQIVEDEKKVVSALQNNARESIDKIAKICKFSRQKVWRIIKRLENNKTIWGYHAVIDNQKINKKQYVILMKHNNLPISKKIADSMMRRDLGNLLKKLGVDVFGSYFIHGSYDWMLSINADDIKQVKKFIDGVMLQYKDNIDDISVLEVIFKVEEFGIQNPNIEKIKDFF